MPAAWHRPRRLSITDAPRLGRSGSAGRLGVDLRRSTAVWDRGAVPHAPTTTAYAFETPGEAGGNPALTRNRESTSAPCGAVDESEHLANASGSHSVEVYGRSPGSPTRAIRPSRASVRRGVRCLRGPRKPAFCHEPLPKGP